MKHLRPRLYALVVGVGLVLVGCDAVDVPDDGLEVVYLAELGEGPTAGGTLPAAGDMPGAAAQHVDLGEIFQTRHYYFLIRNRGSATITNVQLALRDAVDGFSLSPLMLDEVPPFGSVGPGEALAAGLIRITVEHGVAVHGDGSYVPPLAAGVYSFELSVVGSAQSTGELHTAAVSLDLKARVMDVSVFDDDGEVDLLDPVGHVFGGMGAGAGIPSYRVTGDARVVNTGNVTVVVERYYNPDSPEPFLLDPGDEFVVEDGRSAFIVVEETEAVRDRLRWPIFPTGKSYIRLTR